MELGLSPCPSEDEEEEEPEEYKTAVSDRAGWHDINSSTSFIPPISIKNIHHYFIGKRVSNENVIATKPFEKGYRIYDANKVRDVCIHIVSFT